jgi:hypothetical protein
VAQQSVIAIEHALDLTALGLRKDLAEDDYHDTSPECEPERIQQVRDQSERLCLRWRLEDVSTDVSRETNHEAND